MLIKDISFFNEVMSEELTEISGGITVPTTNKIEQGRATIRVDLRGGLKDKNFTGSFENCTAEFDDFNGTLNVSCNLGNTAVNSGQVLLIARPSDFE